MFSTRNDRLWVGLIVALAVLIRFVGLGSRQLWLDELIQLARFSHHGLIESILRLNREIASAPLDFVIQHLVVSVLGPGEVPARLHAALFGSLTVLIFYWLCRWVLPLNACWMATLLLAFNPLHHWYSREGRSYSLLVLLTVTGYWILLKALDRPSTARWTAFGLVTLLSLYTNLLAPVVLGTQILYALLRTSARVYPSSQVRTPLAFSSAAIFPFLLFIPWMVYVHEVAGGNSPRAMLESGLWLRVLKESSGGGYLLSVTLLALAFGAVFAHRRRREEPALVLALVWLLPALGMLFFLLWLRNYHFAARQLLIVVPAFILLASLGLHRIYLKSHGWGITLLILILLISSGSILSKQGKEQADWKGAVSYLKTQPKAAILAPDIELPLSYYLPDLRERALSMEEGQRWIHGCRGPLPLLMIVTRYTPPADSSRIQRIASMGQLQEELRWNGIQIFRVSCPVGAV